MSKRFRLAPSEAFRTVDVARAVRGGPWAPGRSLAAFRSCETLGGGLLPERMSVLVCGQLRLPGTVRLAPSSRWRRE
ncbi:hypothetical protein GCM10009577_64960 [Streptomyces javensis]